MCYLRSGSIVTKTVVEPILSLLTIETPFISTKKEGYARGVEDIESNYRPSQKIGDSIGIKEIFV